MSAIAIAPARPAQGSTAQGSTAQGSTAQGSTAQGSTAQGSTAQGSTAQGRPGQDSSDWDFSGRSAEDATAPGSLLLDDWSILSLDGRAAGFTHVEARRIDPETTELRVQQRLRVLRGQTPVEIVTSTLVREGERGQVLGWESFQGQSQHPRHTTAVRDGNEFVVRRRSGGGEEVYRTPASTAIGPLRARDTLISRLREVGDRVELEVFLPEFARGVQQRTTVEAVDDDAAPSASDTFPRGARFRLTIEQHGVHTTQWVDRDFRSLRSSTRVLGQELVATRASVTEVDALDLSHPPEVFTRSFVPLDRTLPRSSSSALYRVRLRTGTFDAFTPRLFRTGEQREILSAATGEARKTYRDVLVRPRPARTQSVRLANDERARYLAPNAYLQSTAPALRDAATFAAREESEAWPTSQRIARWVRDHVSKVGLGTAFATASEVLATGAGDCTELSVLVAALCRARAIPARVVAGLTLVEGHLVGHMWCEVWIEEKRKPVSEATGRTRDSTHVGQWAGIDATRFDLSVGAGHLGFLVSGLDGPDAANLFRNLVQLIGNVNVELIDFTEGPRAPKERLFW